MAFKRAFTLLEVLIAIAIVGIVASVAYPTYVNYIRKGYRSEAFQAMYTLQLEEEKYRMSSTIYGTLSQLGGSATVPSGRYTIAISNNTATTYTITATASGDQANDTEDGTACSTLTLQVTAGSETKTPAVCWR